MWFQRIQPRFHSILSKSSIQGLLLESMKAKNKVKSSVLKSLLSQVLNNEKSAEKQKSIVSIVRKQIEKTKESMEIYKRENRRDLFMMEEEQLSILIQLQPKDDTEGMERILTEIISKQQKPTLGTIMKELKLYQNEDEIDFKQYSLRAKQLLGE